MQNTNRARRLKRARQRIIARTAMLSLITLACATLLTVSIVGLSNQDSEIFTKPPEETNSFDATPNATFTPAPSTSAPYVGGELTPLRTPSAMFNNLIDPNGHTVSTRFKVPDGFKRVELQEGSFGEYLRELELFPDGERLYFWDGKICDNPAHAAILKRNMPKKYEQCADTVIGLYADYLYKNKQYDKLVFTFNNGFVCDFKHFTQGLRPNKDANGWESSPDYWKGNDERVFKVFLDYVFLYANTASLFENELKEVDINDISVGDVFVTPGFPGHIVLICDMIKNPQIGEVRFMTLQGSMPALQPHIMLNAHEPEMSPWQNTRFENDVFLSATGWFCPTQNLMRFK